MVLCSGLGMLDQLESSFRLLVLTGRLSLLTGIYLARSFARAWRGTTVRRKGYIMYCYIQQPAIKELGNCERHPEGIKSWLVGSLGNGMRLQVKEDLELEYPSHIPQSPLFYYS